MKSSFLDSPKSIKRKRAKSGTANFILVKDCNNNSTHIDDNYELVVKNPDKASEQALVKFQNSFGLTMDSRLFTIASYNLGHYLIYDNRRVVAYTVIRL